MTSECLEYRDGVRRLPRASLPILQSDCTRHEQSGSYAIKIGTDSQDDSDFSVEVRAARSFSEIYQAYRLCYDQYLRCGYTDERRSRLRFFPRDLLPTAATGVAVYNSSVVATATVIRSGVSDIPASSLFSEEIAALTAGSDQVAESTKFASFPCPATVRRGVGRMSAVATALTRWQFHWCRLHNIAHWILVINPKVLDFYTKDLGFEVLRIREQCAHVSNHPGVLVRLRVLAITQGEVQPTPLAERLFLGDALGNDAYYPRHQFSDDEVALLAMDDSDLFMRMSASDADIMRAQFPLVPWEAIRMVGRPGQDLECAHVTPLAASIPFPSIDDCNSDSPSTGRQPKICSLRLHLNRLECILDTYLKRFGASFSVTLDRDVADFIISDPDLLGRSISEVIYSNFQLLDNGTPVTLRVGIYDMNGCMRGLQMRFLGSLTAPTERWLSLIGRVGGVLLDYLAGPAVAALSYYIPAIPCDQFGNPMQRSIARRDITSGTSDDASR